MMEVGWMGDGRRKMEKGEVGWREERYGGEEVDVGGWGW